MRSSALVLLLTLLAAPSPAATKSEILLHMTNGGVDVSPLGGVTVHETQGRKREVAHGRTGGPIRVEAGTYDIKVTMRKGSAEKTVWLYGQTVAGRFEQTIEMDFPLAEQKVIITNGGVPLDSYSSFDVHSPGDRRHRVANGRPGAVITLPPGTYDVHARLAQGSFRSDKWFTDVRWEGAGERTLEMGDSLSHLKVIITNGGVPLDSYSSFDVHRSGDRHHRVASGRPGAVITLPPGTYDVYARLAQGSFRNDKWFTDVRWEGTGEKTLEMGMPLCPFKVSITNGGEPVTSDSSFAVHAAGDRKRELVTGRPGSTVTLPPGTYDLHVTFRQPGFSRGAWFEGFKLEGPLERTIELGLKLARVQVTVLLEGQDVKHKGWFEVRSAGTRDRLVAEARSGSTVVCESGTYDIGAFYRDAGGGAEKWLAGEKIEGTVEKKVELAVPMAKARYTITLDGKDAGGKGWWGLFQPGERDPANRAASARSGEELRCAEGTYDVGIFYEDGGLRVERWLPEVAMKGEVVQSIEIGGTLATVTVTVLRGGKPLEGATYGLYRPSDSANPIATARSGESLRTTAGTFDIGCFLVERGMTAQVWQRGEALAGTVTRTIALEQEMASLTIRAGSTTSQGQSSEAPGGGEGGAPNLLLILDASGSMWSRVEDSTRMEVAREVISEVIRGLPDAELNVGLWIYGARPARRGDCDDVHRVHPLGPVDKPALLAAVENVRPRGWTPIAAALQRAGEDLPPGGNNSIVLVTDGIESCGGDPCAAARSLAARGVATRSFVVGFGLSQDKGRFLECIGRYYPAQSRAQLQAALKEALTESIKPLTGTVTVLAGGSERMVAHGTFDEKIAFPAGTYDVAIHIGKRLIEWKGALLRGDVVSAPADRPPAAR